MRTILFIFIFCTSIFCQTLAIYSGATFPLNIFKGENSNPLTKMWHPGINVGLDYRYNLSKTISISSYCVTEIYMFNDNSTFTSPLPEFKLSNVKGSDSYLIKVGFNMVYQLQKFPLPQGYFFTGFNYSSESIGQVTLTWHLDNAGYSNEALNPNSARYFAHVIGLGAHLVKIQPFDLFFELKSSSNYSNRFSFSINLGAGFTL